MLGSLECKSLLAAAALFGSYAAALPQAQEGLQNCGDARYLPSRYTCYPGNFLCPVINGKPTLKCGRDCYLPEMYSCANDRLVYPPVSSGAAASPSAARPSGSSSGSSSRASSAPASTASSSAAATCSDEPTTFQLNEGPYENFFYSDCHTSTQVVVTSPQPDSNLTIIGPRLLVAWAAGNSGLVAFFQPQNGVNGSLGIQLENFTETNQPLRGVYAPSDSANPFVGVRGQVNLNSSAVLTTAILGSIRTMRDFTEGPSILVPEIQNAINFSTFGEGGAKLSRRWLDNVTVTNLVFTPTSGNGGPITINNRTLEFEAGTYVFEATFDYPQLEQLSAQEVLNPASQGLIAQNPDQTKSLAFLSYTTKLLAGAWRFLTYFGRDSMISALLLQPVLSEGEGGAIEAVISAVLERLNRTDGSVAHEETIGDYATYLSMKENKTSTAPQYDYKMIDSDYYLPVLMRTYFVDTPTGQQRKSDFLSTQASINPANADLTYGQLALINAEKIMNTSAPFAAQGGQVKENLIHLKEGQIVGEWRDSTYGIGGGRIPYDVNTALVPAALREIATLARAGFFPSHPEWSTTADRYAQVWEDNTLQFFQVTISQSDAVDLVNSYVSESNYGIPSEASSITSDVTFYGLALDGNNNQSIVRVMNTDDCFRLFFLNTTNNAQLTAFINQTADHINHRFPAGLSTDVGLVVANPAFGGDPVYAANFTNNAYHGPVVWGWPLAMMAAGLDRQLSRCSGGGNATARPAFCSDAGVYGNVRRAYNNLWDTLEANRDILSGEVWSWVYRDGEFQNVALGALPPPPGQNPTESDIVQLWSLTFLAVKRDEALR